MTSLKIKIKQLVIKNSFSPRQKLSLIHKIIKDDAKRFYQERIENFFSGFSVAV